MSITPQQALSRAIEHREIFPDEMLHLMRLIMRGEISPLMVAAITAALRVKKETVGEITAAAQVMREFVTPVAVADRARLVDVVGSTCAMFVAAAAGARVAKHGGRSVSSKSGSADVMEALGMHINLAPAQIAQCIEEAGLGFMFAPNHHPAMKNVAAIRKEMGVKTIFNLLGPLTNPADAPNILMGVFHPDLTGIQVRVLQALGAQHALVVHGLDGIDEITLGAPTLVAELKEGRIHEYEVRPEDFGLTRAPLEALRIATPAESVALIHQVLDNQPGPARDVVALNAGGTLYAAGVAPSLAAGVQQAQAAIASGAARAKLQQAQALTQRLTAASA